LTDLCKECGLRSYKVHEQPIAPDMKEGAEILFLSDFPLEEDLEFGRVLSGLHRRASFLHSIIKNTKLNQDNVSHATVLRCITKSKSVLKKEHYFHCGNYILEDIKNHEELKAVVCFGSVAGRLMTGKEIDSIEKVRGQFFDTVIPGVFCIITYSLGLMVDSSGCGGCGTNVQPYLARKDVQTLKKELKRRANEERKAQARKDRKE